MDPKDTRGRVLRQGEAGGCIASTRLRAWKEDEDGALLVWPALWRTRQRQGLWSSRTRWIVGFLWFRLAVVKTTARAADSAHTPGWEEAGGQAFLEWLRKHSSITPRPERRDVQAFFKNNDRWRALVALGGLDNYYTRLLIARELQGDLSK